jgi:hypothetical protein
VGGDGERAQGEGKGSMQMGEEYGDGSQDGGGDSLGNMGKGSMGMGVGNMGMGSVTVLTERSLTQRL